MDKQRDPISGKEDKRPLLNRKKVSEKELDDWFNCESMRANDMWED